MLGLDWTPQTRFNPDAMDAEASAMSDIDAPSGPADVNALPALVAALATLEDWLQEANDDPAGDTASAHAAQLMELAQNSSTASTGKRLESIAALVAVLGSSIAGAQRRAVRTGFDLHDGPLQHVLVTALELQTLRRELEELPAELGRKPLERLSTVHSRLVALEGELRELAHALETPSWSDVPLDQSVRSELARFEEECGIQLRASIEGDFTRTSRSQRIAVLRVLQGALSNVRRHSEATTVHVALVATAETIELVIEDNGRGFVARDALADAARRGRLGIVAMGERIRMLGGEFDLDSSPGGPTRLSVSLRSTHFG